MIRVLLIATIVFSALAANFALKARKSGEACMAERDQFEDKAKKTEVALTKEKTEKKDLEGKLKKVEKESNENRDQAEKLRTELAQVQEEQAQLTAKNKETEAELAKAKEEMARAKAPENRVNLVEIEAKMADLRSQVDKAQQTAGEQERRADGLQKKIDDAIKKREEAIQKAVVAKKESIRTTVGRVVAYNESWNFVVVNIGDKQGVTPESELEVKRDGKVVAKLRITNVEPMQTTAGVLFEDAFRGMKLAPGDSVMFHPNQVAKVTPATIDTTNIPSGF